MLRILLLAILSILIPCARAVSTCSGCENGFCVQGSCICRTSWGGTHCDEFAFDQLPGFEIFYRVLFSLLFGAELVLTLAIMIRTIQANASYYHRAGFVLIAIDCVIQILLFTFSPETTPGLGFMYVAAIINLSHYTIVYVTYCVYLSLWIELNEKHKRMHKGMNKVVKRMEGASVSGDSGSSPTYSQGTSVVGTSFSSDSTKASSESPMMNISVTSLPLVQEAGTEPQLDVVVRAELPKELPPDPPEKKEEAPTGIRALIEKGLSEKALKRLLIFSCTMLLLSQAARVGLYEIPGGMAWGAAQYFAIALVAYVGIIIGFELYKRAFLSALRESRKSEVLDNLKKVTRTTIGIAILLGAFGIFGMFQLVIPGWRLVILIYVVRAITTFLTIGIYLNCFGGNAIEHFAKEIRKKLGFSANPK